MAHTEKELQSYKDKAQELTSIFGEKSLDAVEQITTTLENLLAWDEEGLPYSFKQFILGEAGKEITKEEFEKERQEILGKL